MLKVNNIEVFYNDIIPVLKWVSPFSVKWRCGGSIRANGAGKSNVFSVIKKGHSVNKADVVEVLDICKEEKDWNVKRAIPTKDKLIRLGLGKIPVNLEGG